MQKPRDGIIDGMKICAKCKVKKPVHEFYTYFNVYMGRDYTEPRCAECKTDASLKYRTTKEGRVQDIAKLRALLRCFVEAYDARNGRKLKIAAEDAREELRPKSRVQSTQESARG